MSDQPKPATGKCDYCNHLSGNHVETGCGVPDCDCDGFVEPKPATGEWTVEEMEEVFPSTDFEGRPFLIPHTYRVMCGSTIICTTPFRESAQGIADAHNAALAAERQESDKRDQIISTQIDQLAAERDRSEALKLRVVLIEQR